MGMVKRVAMCVGMTALRRRPRMVQAAWEITRIPRGVFDPKFYQRAVQFELRGYTPAQQARIWAMVKKLRAEFHSVR